MATIEVWTSDRLDDLADLCEAALPSEALSPDELLAACWDDPGLVAGTSDGDAAVSASVHIDGEHTVGTVRLVVVHPGARRSGIGSALLAAAEDWAFDQGASEVRIDRGVGLGLWPGVDVHTMAAMLCLAEGAGYCNTGARCNLSVPATFRASPPDGIEVRRVIEPADEGAVLALVAAERPAATTAVARSIGHGSCLAAFVDGAVGVASHSVNRAGWLGPMLTAESHRRRGIGAALLGAVAKDMMVANFRDVEVTGADGVRLFVGAGGSVSRVFRTYARPRP